MESQQIRDKLKKYRTTEQIWKRMMLDKYLRFALCKNAQQC